ncbi:AraC family transcriptional regulator [Pseudomonas tremae]|uniref:AraC family transcriptional regulator n=1 Tax=Pseudomonas tremae TaxID=200454 RepID=UPI002108CA8F|nr:AraC family transcriptional regulator [Pseudomonas tremae]MCQ3024655.1 AraC family transcriptional regulator [Pseudomonas tremae]
MRFDVCCQRLQTLGAPLHVIRSDAPSELIHAVHRPALCLIVQGRKEVGLGDEQYVYDPLSYLVVAVTVPVSGQVIEASCDAPYLCIRLDFDPVQIARLIADAPLSGVPDEPQRGLFLDRIDQPLLETVLRLVRLLDTPRDIGMLAPLALQYQKQLRLQEARWLMINEGLDVSSACYRVGSESPLQFSREYSRQFGCPPSTDLSRVRQIV